MIKLFTPFSSAAFSIILLLVGVRAHSPQYPILEKYVASNNISSRKQVAIIGAGIGGASVAHFIRNNFYDFNPVDITVFESTAIIGGRMKSVKYRGHTVELGAQYWSKDDWCMGHAMSEVGLKGTEKGPEYKLERPQTVGVWGGEAFVLVETDTTEFSSWWHLAMSIWREGLEAWQLRKVSSPYWDLFRATQRYGSSPLKLRAAILSKLQSYNEFGRKPFDVLKDELFRAGLQGSILRSAQEYLQSLNLTSRFTSEIVQPSSGARFGQALTDIRGVASLVAIRDILSKKVRIARGNNRLIDRLVKLSDADLKLNTRVASITKGEEKKFKVTYEATSSTEGRQQASKSREFDAVIIAAPFPYNGINMGSVELKVKRAPEPVYAEKHVTHFATPERLFSAFFNLSSNATIPDNILTTTTNSNGLSFHSIHKVQGIFFIDRTGCETLNSMELSDCDTVIYENIYRVLSNTPVDRCTLAKMAGKECNYAFPFFHHQAWPYAFPQLQDNSRWSDEVEIAPNLFYLSGGEEIVSPLEMSCRMGYNAARKLSTRWRWEKT